MNEFKVGDEVRVTTAATFRAAVAVEGFHYTGTNAEMRKVLPEGRGVVIRVNNDWIQVKGSNGLWNFHPSELEHAFPEKKVEAKPKFEKKETIMNRKRRVEFLYDDGSRYTCRNVNFYDDDSEMIVIQYTHVIDGGFITQKIEQEVPKKNVVAATIFHDDGSVEVVPYKDRVKVHVWQD